MKDFLSKLMTGNVFEMVAALAILFLVLILLFKSQGFFNLLCKAISTVLQQLCSLILEAVFLMIKLISAVEVYIVLLIDALTGKASSNGKIASLAIGVLSIASYYTTYSGMCLFVDNSNIVMLITLGIQAILLATSLRIGDNLIVSEENKDKFPHGKKILLSTSICICSCIIAYLFGLSNFSLIIKEKIYGILYAIVIVTTIFATINLIRGFIEAECKNYRLGIILLCVYFAVLSVSSFFSYNEFVTVMYSNEVREIDTFTKYKTKVFSTLENLRETIDDEYYENVGMLLEQKLYNNARELDNVDVTAYFSPKEQQLYERSSEFEKYIKNVELSKQKEKKLAELKTAYDEKVNNILKNNIDVGRYTVAALENAETEYNTQKKELDIDYEITTDIFIIQNVDGYRRLKQKMSNEENNYQDIAREALLYLNKKDLSQEDIQILESAVETIAEATYTYLDVTDSDANTKNMLYVYREYINFIEKYDKCLKEIMGISVQNNSYKEACEKIRGFAHDIMIEIPTTEYVFKNHNTEDIHIAEYYHQVELYFRNSDSKLNIVEKNMRTFIDNKLIGITSAALALLIDMMILFVGLIIPQNVDFWSDTKYSKYDKDRILANLFNKPIKR